MEIKFQPYKESNLKDLEICMEKLQDYLIEIDPLKRLIRLPTYGKKYTQNLIKKILKQDGLIILAYDEKKIIGCIAGTIEVQSKDNLLECIPTKSGRVLELFVLESYRGHQIGKRLMEKMEEYFKKKNCDIIRIEVFKPNTNTHNFYQRLNYQDRVIDMVKSLK